MNYSLTLNQQTVTAPLPDNKEIIEGIFKLINNKKIVMTITESGYLTFTLNGNIANQIIIDGLSFTYSDEEVIEAKNMFTAISTAIWTQPETAEKRLARLASLSPIERDAAIREEAKKLNCKVSTLEKEVKLSSTEETLSEKMESERAYITEYYQSLYKIATPTPIEGNLSEVLQEIETLIRAYFYMPYDCDYILATYWCVYTWWADKMPYNPLAVITAPEYSCGKTELMKFMAKLSKKSHVATRASVSDVTKIVNYIKPTLFVDESDITMTEDLRSLIDIGVDPEGKLSIQVLNDTIKKWLPELYTVFCPKCICGVGKQSRSIETRSVIIHMAKAPSYISLKDTLDFFDDKIIKEKINTLQSKLEYLSQNVALPVKVTASFTGRYRQIFRSLLFIASMAGEEEVISINKAFAQSIKIDHQLQTVDRQTQLLHAIYDIFEGLKTSELATTYIIMELVKDSEAQWDIMGPGNTNITSWNIKTELAKFGDTSIKSHLIGSKRLRGYLFSDIQKLYMLYNKRGD